MRDFAKISFVGKVLTDPVFDGKILKFGVGVTDGKNGENYQSSFFSCKVFGDLADILSKEIKKMDSVFVSGRPSNQSYEKEGEKKSFFCVIVNNVELIDKEVRRPIKKKDEDIF